MNLHPVERSQCNGNVPGITLQKVGCYNFYSLRYVTHSNESLIICFPVFVYVDDSRRKLCQTREAGTARLTFPQLYRA